MAKYRHTTLPPPYLRRIWLDLPAGTDPAAFPRCLPLFRGGFELDFDSPITIIAGENGVGKSTLLEGIAVLAGFDESGGGPGLSRGRQYSRKGNGARLLAMGRYGIDPIELEDTSHFRIYRQFASDPHGLVRDMLDE